MKKRIVGPRAGSKSSLTPRKVAAFTLAVVLAFALLPALTAHAAASGSATLLGDTTVFPTATDPDTADVRDGRRIFQIRINNTAPPISLNGLGTSISRVRILFPPNVGNPKCQAMPSENWQCKTFGTPGAEGIALQGGSIAPGSSATFEFDGFVNAPMNNDRTDAFRVQVADGSGDGFSTASGALDLTVRALQTSGDIDLSAARDGEAFDAENRVTSGQPVSASYKVRNHAQEFLGVSADLDPTARTTLTSFTDPAPNGGIETATFSVDTSGVTGSTQNVGLVSKVSSPNAAGDEVSQPLVIDAPVTLDVGALNGGDGRRIANGAGVTLQVGASKGNPPRIEPLTTTVSLTLPQFEGETPVTATTSNTLGAGTQNYLLDFGIVPVGFAVLDGCAQLGGTETCPGAISVDGTFIQTGFDSNGAAVSYTELVPGLLIIDLLGPSVAVDGIGSVVDDRIKEGDTVTINGTVRTGPDSSEVPNDIDASTLVVKVGGNVVENAAYNATTGEISGSYEVPVGSEPNAPTFGREGLVSVTASISDGAGNAGQGDDALIVDNLDPFISPVVLRDHDGDPATDPLPEPMAYLVDGALYGEDGPVIRASFAPGGGAVISDLAKDPVAGGCSPTQWQVDDTNVVEILYWNGDPCVSGEPAPALDETAPPGSSQNDRIIVTLENLRPRDLPINVTYNPDALLSDPTTDLVENEAVRTIATVVNGLNPLIPSIIDFERVDVTAGDATTEGEWEDVGQSADAEGNTTYHFNTPQLRFTLNQVTVGDFLQFRNVTDGTNMGEIQMGANGEFTITPQLLAELDQAFAPAANRERIVELQYRREVPGQADLFSPQPLRIVLVHDTVSPALAPVTTEPELVDNGDGTHDVDVFFDEELNGGEDDPIDWSALYANPNPANGDNPWIPHYVNNVTSDSENRTKRTLVIELNGPENIDAFEYEFIDFGGFRYEDLAGNLTAAQQFVAQKAWGAGGKGTTQGRKTS